MKIVVSGYIGKNVTGVGRYLMCLLDAEKSGNQYIVYTNKDMKDHFQIENKNVIIKTYFISRNQAVMNLLWTTFIFPFVVLKERADWALIPNFTLLLLKFRPTVIILHDLIEFNVKKKFSKKKMFYRTKLADPISARRADKIITVSENSKQDIIKFLKISEKKITVIYCGVDRLKFSRMNEEKARKILQQENWPEEFLLYAGTIDHPGKNAISVIQAFEKLKYEEKYAGALVLAGMPGLGYEYIQEYVRNSNYRSEIFFTGYITDRKLIALYSKCQVFCFMSLYEGFGMPPLEALACGAKVVTSNTSSLPEVIGDVGWTADPKSNEAIRNAIMLALKHQEGYKELEKIDKHLEKYDWNALAEKLSMVFH